MKKYFIGLLCSLLSVSCVSLSGDSDIVLEHNYNLVSVSPVIKNILQDCYHPDFAHQFHKLNHLYYGLSWQMVDLQDDIDLGLNSKITHIVLKIMSGDDSITIGSVVNPNMYGHVTLIGMPNDNAKLKSILATEVSQICLTAYGPIEGPLQARDAVSFHVDLDYKL